MMRANWGMEPATSVALAHQDDALLIELSGCSLCLEQSMALVLVPGAGLFWPLGVLGFLVEGNSELELLVIVILWAERGRFGPLPRPFSDIEVPTGDLVVAPKEEVTWPQKPGEQDLMPASLE